MKDSRNPETLLAANRMGYADGVSDAEQALDEALAEARNAALEEAAAECDAAGQHFAKDEQTKLAFTLLARIIRALKTKESA